MLLHQLEKASVGLKAQGSLSPGNSSAQTFHGGVNPKSPPPLQFPDTDPSSIADVLKEIHQLIEDLFDVTSEDQKVRENVAKIFRETVIEVDEIHRLRSMFDAVTAAKNMSDHTNGTFAALATFEYLLRLMEIKRRSESVILSATKAKSELVQKHLRDAVTVPVLNKTTLKNIFTQGNVDDETSYDPQRRRGVFPVDSGQKAWIEWKTAETRREVKRYHEALLGAVSLAQMLSSEGPRCLVSPTCIGYVNHCNRDPNNGWIFEVPPSSDEANPFMTLHSVLGQKQHTPTLNQRRELALRLCSSVLPLHTADWLHHAIHNGNIMFSVEMASPISIALSCLDLSIHEPTVTQSSLVVLTRSGTSIDGRVYRVGFAKLRKFTHIQSWPCTPRDR